MDVNELLAVTFLRSNNAVVDRNGRNDEKTPSCRASSISRKMNVDDNEVEKRPEMDCNRCPDGKEAAKRPYQRRWVFDSMPVESKTFIPRPYQVEIFELAKKRNTVVCLGTGTGKTFIAVMLIDHFSHQIRDDYSGNGKRTFVIVPKVPLVSQQAKVIKNHLDLKVGEYIGEMNVVTWDKKMWENELTKNQVLVMTAEIFRVMITHGFLSLSKVNLLVLDEAHWAIGNHPYREIMRCFDMCRDPPRILGLSASLINCKAKPRDLKKLIVDLEKTLRATCETASDLRTVSKYGTKPVEVLWYFNPPKPVSRNPSIIPAVEQLASFSSFLNELNPEIGTKGPTNITQVRKCLGTANYILESMGYWCAKQVAEIYITELSETTAMFNNTDPLHSGLLSAATSVLYVLQRTINNILAKYSRKDRLKKFSSPKLFCLLDILSGYKPVEECQADEETQQKDIELMNKPLCGIVFAERRAVVRVLCMWLQELAVADPENFGFLKVEYVLGHGGNSGGMNSRMSNKRQEEALSKFRKHECNLLIATSVLEEGLDVPRCNLVVRYDMPKSFREYMQSKGRARAEKGRYIMLIENETEKMSNIKSTLKEFVEIEEILMQSCSGRSSPSSDEDDSNDDDILPPFMPIKEDGAPRVTLNSAITLVNRYCLKLPSDSFTKLAPHCTIESISECSYKCSIRLPINSPIRETIEGQVMSNKKLAKKAAALEVCKRLHKEGELDDNLLPVGKEGIKDAVELGLEPYDDENERGVKGQARPGTTKRRQYYFKRIAGVLRGAPLKSSEQCKLYVLLMKLTCAIPEEQNTRGRKITDPADTPQCFGFVTASDVPPIPSFPVFTRSGEVMVSLEEIGKRLTLSDRDLERIKNFHKFTFQNVLNLVKYPMRYSPEKSHCSFFIVPVLADYSNIDNTYIDWQFIEKVENYEKIGESEVSEERRKNFVFDKAVYEDAVIKPWYQRNKIPRPGYFYVAEITKLTPLSKFPDSEFNTFELYYKKKYGENIMNLDQPLLDVDHTSARLNLLTPRFVNRKGMTLPMSTQKTKKEKRENLQQKQILVPELCIVHPFPASFWRKAVCLPCILYRLNSLLVAEELRQEVALNIGVGVVKLPPGKSWPPLDFGWTLADVLSQAGEKANAAVGTEDASKSPEVWSDPEVQNTNKNAQQNKNADVKSDDDFVIDTFDPSQYKFGKEFDEEFDNFNNDTMEILPLNGPNSFPGFGGPISNWEQLEQEVPGEQIGSWDDMDHELDDVGNWDDVKDELTFIGGPVGNWNGLVKNGESTKKKIREIDDEGNFIDDEDEEPCIRIGSPSRFENDISNWECGWDDNTQIFDIGVPGLTTISGPTGLNLQGLSKDLATCQEKGNWDLFDDYDSDDELMEDDEAAEFDPSYDKKAVNFASSSKQNKKDEFIKGILNNGLCTKADVVYSTDDEGISELCLKNAAMSKVEEDIVVCDIEKRFSVVEGASNLDDDVEFTNAGDIASSLKFDYSLENEVDEVATIFEKSQSPIMNNIDEQPAPEIVVDTADLENNLPEPSFGELLPNRDQVVVAESTFRFDPYKEDYADSEGPNPCAILQALTMSNASDGINLERLETVGDSFLKYAVTAFLYCFCPSIHEGKLSYLRSRQISNYNLYRLGKRKGFGQLMVGTKFEPNDNWLPPGYALPEGLEQALIDSGHMDVAFDIGALSGLNWENMSEEEIRDEVMKRKAQLFSNPGSQTTECETFNDVDKAANIQRIPYNLLTQHSIPDKSIADCVEALIGAYLISSGPKGAMLFMRWLGLKVMPDDIESFNTDPDDPVWHWLPSPKSPLLFEDEASREKLLRLYRGSGLNNFEKDVLKYEFKDKAYLVQAFTHNSYCDNHVTDCYQRLEFLGDAVLDFLITRHLYEDPQKHSPGVLTDLRSALVNNTFFASLAVKYEFQKYLKLSSYDLFRVISAFVAKCISGGCSTTGEECNLYMAEGECEYSEDVEVPKALGDIFESVAGAIFLDSGMSLDAVWRVYYAMMKPEIDRFSKKPPKSHIRELLETEPQNAVFGKPELIPGRKVRVVVEVFNEGKFVGVGRNKRLAKCTAAKRALRALKAKRNCLQNV